MPNKVIKSKQSKYEKDYAKLFKSLKKNPHHIQVPQWSDNGDYFVKFSLYDDSLQSMTSADTSLISSF